MKDIALLGETSKIIEQNGVNVYLVRSSKFKTNSVSVFLHDNLVKEHATLNALLPMVLRRGTNNLPRLQEISKHLEELYGASFDCGINKKGERHMMFYYIEVVNDAYALKDSNLVSESFKFLSDILSNPVIDNGGFRSDYVEQEKYNLKRLIESRVNDKRQYAVDRCYEEMCADERFGLYEYGNVDDIDGIDGRSLYEHYKKVLDTMPMDVFVVGDVSPETVKEAFSKYFGFAGQKSNNLIIPETELVYKSAEEYKTIFEKMDVNQGKLCLGLRTNIAPTDDEYYALVLCNGILGGGVHSKLFQNVREKASLAYYAYSRLERFKGLMAIESGIEVDNYEKTLDIMRKQLEEIKAGNITKFEYDATVKSIETGLKSMTDSQIKTVDFLLVQLINGSGTGVEDFIERIRKVKLDDIVNVAKRIKLDTVYFLSSRE